MQEIRERQFEDLYESVGGVGMDCLLKDAQSLYISRQRISIATLMIILTVVLYSFYSPGIYGFGATPPEWFPVGWTETFEVVVSLNTVAFFLAFSLIVFAYGLWSWAFFPGPAVSYTVAALRGFFGQNVKIKHSIGKRFRVFLESGRHIDVRCRIKEARSKDWLVYQFTSCHLTGNNLHSVAMRHGMSSKDGRFTTWIGHDELHHRALLMAKAMASIKPGS
jgi:hypothetical protein